MLRGENACCYVVEGVALPTCVETVRGHQHGQNICKYKAEVGVPTNINAASTQGKKALTKPDG
jgi:hypothetical protein